MKLNSAYNHPHFIVHFRNYYYTNIQNLDLCICIYIECSWFWCAKVIWNQCETNTLSLSYPEFVGAWGICFLMLESCLWLISSYIWKMICYFYLSHVLNDANCLCGTLHRPFLARDQPHIPPINHHLFLVAVQSLYDVSLDSVVYSMVQSLTL